MTKLSTTLQEKLIGKSAADFDDADVARINAFEKTLPDNASDFDVSLLVARANMDEANNLGDPQTAEILSTGELQARVAFLEMVVQKLVDKYFPEFGKLDASHLDKWQESRQPSELVDKTAYARG